MDGVHHLGAHGMRAIHLRANWDGHRDGFGSQVKTEISKMGSRHFRACSFRGEHDQCRIRFSRHVGCRRDAHGLQFPLVRRAPRHRDRLFDGPFSVLSNRKDFEMAGAVSLCLCHNGFCGRTRLAHRSARHVHLPFKSAHYFYGVREIRRASKFSRPVNYFPLFAISFTPALPQR